MRRIFTLFRLSTLGRAFLKPKSWKSPKFLCDFPDSDVHRLAQQLHHVLLY